MKEIRECVGWMTSNIIGLTIITSPIYLIEIKPDGGHSFRSKTTPAPSAGAWTSSCIIANKYSVSVASRKQLLVPASQDSNRPNLLSNNIVKSTSGRCPRRHHYYGLSLPLREFEEPTILHTTIIRRRRQPFTVKTSSIYKHGSL